MHGPRIGVHIDQDASYRLDVGPRQRYSRALVGACFSEYGDSTLCRTHSSAASRGINPLGSVSDVPYDITSVLHGFAVRQSACCELDGAAFFLPRDRRIVIVEKEGKVDVGSTVERGPGLFGLIRCVDKFVSQSLADSMSVTSPVFC